jgi:hypothetical protein
MPEHGSILLPEDIFPNMDLAVHIDAEDILIVRRMMNFTQGKPVGDDGDALVIAVRYDMRRIQKLRMVKPADGAPLVIRRYYEIAERVLVKAVWTSLQPSTSCLSWSRSSNRATGPAPRLTAPSMARSPFACSNDRMRRVGASLQIHLSRLGGLSGRRGAAPTLQKRKGPRRRRGPDHKSG